MFLSQFKKAMSKCDMVDIHEGKRYKGIKVNEWLYFHDPDTGAMWVRDTNQTECIDFELWKEFWKFYRDNTPTLRRLYYVVAIGIADGIEKVTEEGGRLMKKLPF